jgi:hypothetical protein
MKLEDVQKCPECHNEFMQPFTCTTCGAQKLYDATLATAENRLALAVAALKNVDGKIGHFARAPHDDEMAVVSLIGDLARKVKETIAQIEESK